ncbi:terminase large subunit [Hymenobacter cheonanensis]|uniref:terminase large subunit n=1 Tax=Hymenobacter sp. CA2-7 TaxID=3063993 RepID=UPI002712EA36|nr:terminase TerL endonuclease subunit [Hymenobacter sp. CA2-7]MDO7888277.1 terminase large subunit [Hymenobacter sp. CA2-7]
MSTLAPWHQYAHDVTDAGRAEAAVQDKLRPILLRIGTLKKDKETDHTAQIAALERKAEPLRAQLRALPLRVGRYTYLAGERHLRDLENGAARGLRFDEKAATIAVKFFGLLTHNKGRWAGTPLTLEPWQQFFIASLFGWKRADGTRRFRESYLEVARKNGKSTVGSGVCLELLILDGEAGAEIYTAATKKEQARIVFGDAQNMARKSTALLKKIKVQQNAIFMPSTLSTMKPMSSDSKTEDGLNPHGIYIDEYHAHPNDGLYSVLKSATGARAQPLLSIITTAGFNRLGPCAQLRKACIDLLEAKYHDDSYFVLIYALDEAVDDWNDESTWQKANPNLGVSVGLDYLREQYAAAVRTPSQQVPFKTKHLNLWTDASAVWLPHELWMAGATGTAVAELAGRKAWGGLDLASVRDITALVFIFPKEGGAFDVLCWFWVPEDSVDERTKKDGVPYRQWVDEGYLLTTPGNVTDYNFIKAQVTELCETYLVQMIEYDRFNASQMVIDLTEAGVPMQPFGQGFVSMNAPTKELEKLVLDGSIHHYGNPVLAWMMGNVELARDPADNIKINKGKSKEKVDGAVALVEALGGYMSRDKEPEYIYQDGRGFIVL